MSTPRRLAFLRHYTTVSARRVERLRGKPEAWFEDETRFFDVMRPRAWLLARSVGPRGAPRG